jgi:peptidoglycan/xylan/chitin deacetylase (PgdA/CDA1 family)
MQGAAIALTFDDGYACNAEVAAPILDRFAAPATIFLAKGGLAGSAEFWWDALEQIIACARAGHFEIEIDDRRSTAATSDRALVSPGCDSLALPRLQVGDWTASQLARALDA